MPDPIAKKRLKKKMLDRWENEGGSIASDTNADASRPASQGKGRGKKLSSERNNSPADTAAPLTTRRKPNRK